MSAPSTPIGELITLDLMEALADVISANGYTITLSAIERYDPSGNTEQAWKAIVGLREATIDGAGSYPSTQSLLHFGILVYVDAGEAPDVPYESVLWRVHADICRAVMKDPTRGGLATGGLATKVLPPEFGDDGLVVPVNVSVRWLMTDPTKQT
jgi:hypothetical protein